jgi:hypothetical protein
VNKCPALVFQFILTKEDEVLPAWIGQPKEFENFALKKDPNVHFYYFRLRSVYNKLNLYWIFFLTSLLLETLSFKLAMHEKQRRNRVQTFHDSFSPVPELSLPHFIYPKQNGEGKIQELDYDSFWPRESA